MIGKQYFEKGLSNLKRSKFKEARENFEDCVSIDFVDANVYVYLGITHILLGNDEEGSKYTIKAYQTDKRNLLALNTYGFLKLKDGLIDEAVNYWLDVLDIDPDFKISKRNLNLLKKTDNIQTYLTQKKYKKFLLDKPIFIMDFDINILKKHIIIPSISVLVVITIILLINFIPKNNNKNNIVLPNIKLPEINDYIIDNSDKKVLFSYNKKDIERMFKKVKLMIKKKKYNSSVTLINKILHSNAKKEIKEKFYFLKNFLKKPDDLTKIKSPMYNEVIRLPAIYEGTIIKWKGKIAELSEKKGYSRFKLLINFQDSDRIDGIAIVEMNGYYKDIKNGDYIEIIGEFLGYKGKMNEMYIEGLNILLIPAN